MYVPLSPYPLFRVLRYSNKSTLDFLLVVFAPFGRFFVFFSHTQHTNTHAEHTLNEFRWSPRLVALNVSGASVVVDCRLSPFRFLAFRAARFFLAVHFQLLRFAN